MNIKPIETRYKGYLFRSRLEARWAVFLDSLGIPWEYEKEGYELFDGTRYLPDFWLPDQPGFLEVKGGQALTNPEARREARFKAAKLATSSGYGVLLVCGAVGEHEADIFHPKHLVEPEFAQWVKNAPESIRSLGWFGLPEELVLPDRNITPAHLAWTKVGRSTDVVDGRLAAVVCEASIDYETVQEPAFGGTLYIEQFTQFTYSAFDLQDPYEAIKHSGGSYQQSRAHQEAIAAARSARFEFGQSGAR